MKPENYPDLEVGVTITRRRVTGEAIASVWVLGLGGQKMPLHKTEWASGRPTPDQLALLAATVMEEVETSIVAAIGVQGVMPM